MSVIVSVVLLWLIVLCSYIINLSLIYFKILFLKRGGAIDFIKQKYENISLGRPAVILELVLVVVAFLVSVMAGLISLYFMGSNLHLLVAMFFLMYNIYFIISCDIDKIASISTPEFRVGRFRMTISKPFGLQGSIIRFEQACWHHISNRVFHYLIISIFLILILTWIFSYL